MKFQKVATTLAAVTVLTACGAPAGSVDLAPSGPFDAKKDRGRVVHCFVAHMSVAQIGSEVLGLPMEIWRPADAPVEARSMRLKPFVDAVDRADGDAEDNLMREMMGAGEAYVNGFRARAVTGDKEKVFAEALRESEKCDALVNSWGAPPA